MSEKLFACLLRLYPVRFRREYGEAAMRLFRDRLRDERGVFARMRLWLDLMVDLTLSLPREHRRGPQALTPAPVQASGGVPTFRFIDDRPPQPGSFVFGTVAALTALLVFGFLLNRGGRAHFGVGSRSAAFGLADANPAVSQEPAKETTAASEMAWTLSAAERKLVIGAIVADLRTYDKHPVEDQKTSSMLRMHERLGDYSAITGGKDFAALLTSQMRGVIHDGNLVVIFGPPFVVTDTPGPAEGTFHRLDYHFAIQIP
jgi:hypothetical protein